MPKVDTDTGTKHKIDLGELVGIIGRGGKIVVDLAKFADGVSPDEVSTLLTDIEALHTAIEDALED